MIPVQVLLTENELAEQFVSSFGARALAEKFFYWFPLSVRAWLALCADGAYRNYVRSRSLIARSAGEVAAFFAPGLVEMLSLGSGQGDKDLIVLQALRERGARVTYLPVDSSQALLEMACRGALDAGIPTHGIKADFTIPSQLTALAAGPEAPRRLVCLLGNTLGAFDPIAEEEARKLMPQLDYASGALDAISDADAVVLVTEWPEFSTLDWKLLAATMSGNLVIDGRNALDPDAIRSAGLIYEGIGRGPQASSSEHGTRPPSSLTQAPT